MSVRRILVVEDNPKNLKLVRDVLVHWGYEVLVATTGEEGVRVAVEEHLDLVLMDLQLPGIDGTEALHRIKAAPAETRVPVVAVTAFAMNDDREHALRSGFDGYLEKPIRLGDLQGQVEQFLQLGSTR